MHWSTDARVMFFYSFLEYLKQFKEINIFKLSQDISFAVRRIDNMEAALLPDERTDLVSTNRRDMAGHTENWPISKPSSELAARMAVILAASLGAATN